MARIFKYWKPVGSVSSLSSLEPCNIIKCGNLSESHLQMITNSSPPLIPVGRLDKDSSGLLLLTDDQKIVQHLTRTYNPLINRQGLTEQQKNESYGSKYEKIYQVTTLNYVSDVLLQRLREGVPITTLGRRKNSPLKSTRKTLPCRIERVCSHVFQSTEQLPNNKLLLNNTNNKNNTNNNNKKNELYFVLREGRNRQIRKMIGSIGHSVQTLCRLSIGNVSLSGLKGVGDVLPLTESEKEWLGLKSEPPTE